MEFLIKIGKAFMDIWNIIKGVLNMFRGKQLDEENKKEKEELEEDIQNGDISDLNEEIGWKKK